MPQITHAEESSYLEQSLLNSSKAEDTSIVQNKEMHQSPSIDEINNQYFQIKKTPKRANEKNHLGVKSFPFADISEVNEDQRADDTNDQAEPMGGSIFVDREELKEGESTVIQEISFNTQNQDVVTQSLVLANSSNSQFRLNSRSDINVLAISTLDDNSDIMKQKQEFKELTEQLQMQID